MISIVLYGRNDNYGYNLHKRAALSLNCMAEVLTDSSDEILFVDYNTPDDFPTFPEAIQDTLTKRARKLLRILRVRPRIHERYKSRTRLLALEPIARNVAVRRSSPSNRWILSTNTDMIFVPQSRNSLSELARRLAPGIYHAPRIEIPEVLWESLDRRASEGIIRTVREWGSSLHLNEIVLGSNFIRYDGPGDFQLLPRSDLFEIHGFDEDMLLGWHVDSNIAARMLLKYKEVGDLGAQVYGYHCDHTRQVTPAHSHAREQNDWKRFVINVDTADVPRQAAYWGCADDAIEEVHLAANPASVYVQALRNVIGDPLTVPPVVKYSGETYNKVDYDPRHLMPFLADMFVSIPRNSNLAWYGARAETLRLFARMWEKLGFTGRILMEQALIPQDDTTSAIRRVSTAEILTEADVLLFDFGGLPRSGPTAAIDPVRETLRESFRRLIRDERRRLSAGMKARRVIALNAINNEYEGFVCGAVAAAATPFATHMRHGFVLPANATKADWLPLLSVGEAGARVGEQIRNYRTKTGWMAHGPGRHLEEGLYLVAMKVELLGADDGIRPNEPAMLIEIVAGSELVGIHLLTRHHLNNADHKFTFTVPPDVADEIPGIETRIRVLSPVEVALRALTVEPTSASVSSGDEVEAALTISDLLRTADWLPFLGIGPLGRRDGSKVNAECGAAEFVITGPYRALPRGRYEMIAHIEANHGATTPEHVIKADVTVGPDQLVAGSFHLGAMPDGEKGAVYLLRLPFELHAQASELRQIETRIWSSGEQQFRIHSLGVKPLRRRPQEGLFPFALVGEVARSLGGEVRNFGNRIGFAAHSQTIALIPGVYRLTLQLTIEADGHTPLQKQRTCMLVLVKRGNDILAAAAIASGSDRNDDHELIFEVDSDLGAISNVEFHLQVVAAANITLRTLSLEPADARIRHVGPVACELENWLPFLKMNASAQPDSDGVHVREGRAEYAIYGPYWVLPPGRYEMIASIVPPASNFEGKPVITADVAAATGQRQLAAIQWRLGQIRCADPHAAVELRLPFAVAADLPADLRTIESRIFTPGDASFRIRSLAVRVRGHELEHLFPYLTVGECGIHAGGEIKSIENAIGCIAYTPPLDLEFGHYELFVDIVDGSTNAADSSPEASIVIEVHSEAEILAIQACGRGSNIGDNPALTFDVTEEIAAGTGIALYIRATTPTAASIRGVRLARTSSKIAPNRSLPVYLHVGIAGLPAKRGIVARPGKFGTIGYVQQPFPTGRYEAILKVKRIGGAPLGHITITVGGNLVVSRSVEFGPRLLGPMRIPRGPFRICSFEVPAVLPRDARSIQIRIDSDGAGVFLLRSVVVKPKTPIRDLRDKTYRAAVEIFGKIQGALEFKSG
jgi:hypothetical protein